jgi:transposase-like protein
VCARPKRRKRTEHQPNHDPGEPARRGPVDNNPVHQRERNVLDHLPERDRPAVKRQLRHAWAQADHVRALDELRALASELDRSHPGATASLREGLEETLTLTCLGITGNLKKTLESTNPCESMVRHEAPCGRRARTINSQPCRLGCRPRADAAVR